MSKVIEHTERLKKRIYRAYDGTSFKERLQKSLSDPIHQINTELVVTATTSSRMTFNQLVTKLDKMNYYTNYQLTKKKFLTQPHRRVAMYCFQEQGDIKELTHSHILLRIPLEHDVDNVIDIMNRGFNKLDDRTIKLFKVVKETADDVIGNVIYASKQMVNDYTPEDNTFVLL